MFRSGCPARSEDGPVQVFGQAATVRTTSSVADRMRRLGCVPNEGHLRLSVTKLNPSGRLFGSGTGRSGAERRRRPAVATKGCLHSGLGRGSPAARHLFRPVRAPCLGLPSNLPGCAHIGECAMTGFLGDIRYAVRLTQKNPGFTALAVVTLAFGIGAVTSIFSLVNGVLLQPLPYAQPDRLAMLSESFPRMETTAVPFSAPDYDAVARLNRSLAETAAFENRQIELSGIEQPEQVDAVAATANLFSLLGIQPALGRVFTTEEERQRREVAVISHGLWRRAYGSDTKVLGRQLRLNRVNYSIVGVLPASIEFPPRGIPYNNHPADVFTPRSFSSEELQAYGSGYNASVIGRMKPADHHRARAR